MYKNQSVSATVEAISARNENLLILRGSAMIDAIRHEFILRILRETGNQFPDGEELGKL